MGEISNGRDVKWERFRMREISNGRNFELEKIRIEENPNGRYLNGSHSEWEPVRVGSHSELVAISNWESFRMAGHSELGVTGVSGCG